MEEIKDRHVSFGDASKIKAKDRDEINFFHDGKNAIKNMYYVSDIKSNILSMRQLMEKGYSIFMKDRMMHLKDERNHLIAHIEMIKNRMYKLTLRNIQEKCLKINMMDKVSLWRL
jgi:hypothetical protein